MTEYNRVFVDTAPLIYFLENDANFGEASKAVFTEILSTGKHLITSAVTCEEYWFIRTKREIQRARRRFLNLLRIAIYK